MVSHWLVVCGIAMALGAGCRANLGGLGQDEPPDAALVDDAAPIVDAPEIPDAQVDAPVQLLTCVDSYGQAPGFILCAEDATSCTFNATTGGGNCNELCGAFGGVCETAFDNNSVEGEQCIPIDRDPPDDCTTPRSTEICVCGRLEAP